MNLIDLIRLKGKKTIKNDERSDVLVDEIETLPYVYSLRVLTGSLVVLCSGVCPGRILNIFDSRGFAE